MIVSKDLTFISAEVSFVKNEVKFNTIDILSEVHICDNLCIISVV